MTKNDNGSLVCNNEIMEDIQGLAEGCKLVGIWDYKNNTSTDTKIKNLLKTATSLKKDLSLSAIVKQSVKDNKLIDTGTCWPGRKDVNKELNSSINRVRRIIENINEFSTELKSVRFTGSNSSGVREILRILDSTSKTSYEKVAALKKLGHSKTHGLTKLYARSNFFGQGRHRNMDKLYSSLANLNPSLKLDEITSQLYKIKKNVKQTEYVHRMTH